MRSRQRQRRLRVAVVMGGPSAERAISLVSGKAMAQHLNTMKYDVLPIIIDTKRRWLPAPKLLTTGKPELKAITPSYEPRSRRFDVALLALHSFGEDGTVQGFLETLAIPYTGSGILASALAMDKARLKIFCQSFGIITPRGILIEREDWKKSRAGVLQSIRKLSRKAVIKPNASGSSAGTNIVTTADRKAIESALADAYRIQSTALVEEYIKGRELTVATIGTARTPRAFPVVEIIPTRDTFFSYRVKYDGSTKEICPARIPKTLARRLSDIALTIHRAIGASGVIRTDFIVRRGVPYLLETNTLPGMTPESLVPKAAAAAGMSYSELLDELIRIALRARHG